MHAHVHHKYNSINQGLTHHTVYGNNHNNRSSQERAANGRMDSVFRRCTLFPANFIWILLPFTLYPLLLLVPIAFSQSKQIATLPKIKIRSQSPHDCCSRASSAALLVARIARDYFHFIFYACACCHVFYSKFCSGRSVPITTNIDILARSAKFVGKGVLHQADSVTCALTRSHAVTHACDSGSHATFV